MKTRKALILLASVFGTLLIVSRAGSEFAGLGPELRAFPGRLAQAESLGFDVGHKKKLARDAEKPSAARAGFDRLETFLGSRDRFDYSPSLKRTTPTQAGSPRPRRSLESFRADLRTLGALGRDAQGGAHFAWEKGYSLLLPSFGRLRAGTIIADGMARADADRGAFGEATRDVLDVSDPWLTYGTEPILIGDLTRCSSFGILFRTMGNLLVRREYPVGEARRLRLLVEGPAFAVHVSTREYLQRDASTLYMLLQRKNPKDDLDGFSEMNVAQQQLRYGYKVEQVRRAWQSDLLRLTNAAVLKLPSDPYDFDGRARVLAGYDRDARAPRGLKGRFLELLGGTFAGFTEGQRKREAQRRVAMMAAGLRAGEDEASLRTRLGRFATDPYDGKPLRVRAATAIPDWLAEQMPRLDPKALRVVYSVGPNRSDEGGATGKGPDDGDIGLVLPR